MLTKMKLALAMCGALAGGVAAANGLSGGEGRKAEILKKFDLNGDGQLDASERAAMKAEFAAKRAERKAEMLAKYDTNKDGKLDDAERKVMQDDRATAQFAKMDTNKDGQISLDEFKAYRASRPFGHARWGGRHHHRGGMTKL